MLPLTVLGCTVSTPILVEVKSGETFNGTLSKVDSWMNVKLVDVIRTSPNGDKFWKMAECYLKGSSIKYVRMGDQVMDAAKEENKRNSRPRIFRDGRGGRRGSAHGQRGGRDFSDESSQSGTKFAPSKSPAAVKIIKK